MKLQVLKLVLWPNDVTKAPRVVAFRPSAVNLITGASRSGKSAIIEIIDYVLGSGTCSIPKVGPIRKSTSWYGLVVDTDEGQKLLARRDPGEQQSTDDYYLAEGNQVEIPFVPGKNSNRDAVLGMLSRLAQLPQANADFFETGSGFKGRASFRDMAAFVFQPQTIVANKDTLFYKANEEEHARKLREVFPLVLGAVDADTLVKQHRLMEVRRLLERKRRQLDAIRASVRDYEGLLRGRLVRAVELGLVDTEVGRAAEDLDSGVLVERLKEVVRRWRTCPDPKVGDLSFGSERVARIRQEEARLASDIAELRLRLTQIRELSMARATSQRNVSRRKDRLAAVSWLSSRLRSEHACPFCGNHTTVVSDELKRLVQETEEVEALWNGIQLIPPMLDAEEVEVRKQIARCEEQIRQLRTERQQIERESLQARELYEARAHFVGRLEEFFDIQASATDAGDLEMEISRLEAEQDELAATVDPTVIAQRKEASLFRVSRFAQHYGSLMQLETRDDLMQLDTSKLTIRVISQDGSAAWLREIGSGANWLGFHVATLLALHELFVSQDIPYVPSLLVLDQPSQTHFPDDTDEESEVEEYQAVRKAFIAFSSAIDRTKGSLQVIVSDHAGGRVLAGIKNAYVVERWRRGRRLIPWHWHEAALQEVIGARADAALEDLMDDVVLPALTKSLDPVGELDVDIVGAVFEKDGLVFKLLVKAHQGETVSVRGLIRRDLTVEWLEPNL